MNTLTDFYRQQAWRELRARLMLERVTGSGELICEHCHKPIIKASQCIGHHKIALTMSNVTDWNISLNPDNIALVHISCHNDIHERWQGSWTQKVYVVYGAPCSGKTTFVRENMTRGDLVVDMDNLWQALTYGDRYDKPASLQLAVFNVKSALINAVKQRHGTWRTAWVIGGLPFSRDRETLATQVDGELIYVEATQDECLRRLEQDKERTLVREQWTKYITDWFDKYQP